MEILQNNYKGIGIEYPNTATCPKCLSVFMYAEEEATRDAEQLLKKDAGDWGQVTHYFYWVDNVICPCCRQYVSIELVKI